MTEHTDYEFKTIKKFDQLAKQYLQRLDDVTVIHQGIYDYFLARYKINSNKLHLVYNGVDINKFKPDKKRRSKEEGRESTVILGWVGRVHHQKNLAMAIRCVALLVGKYRLDIELMVVGEGELLEDSRQLSQQLGIKEYVKFLGRRENVSELMRRFDIYIMSSITEGVPFTLLEAQASGLPAVVPDVGGINYFVAEGETGYLFPGGDIDKMAALIAELSMDEFLRQKVGQEARREAENKYSDNKILAQYKTIILGE